GAAGNVDLTEHRGLDEMHADRATRRSDKLDSARLKASLLDDLSELEDAERSHNRGLDHHRVAAGNGCRKAACHQLEGGIPRHDLPHHAERLPARVVEAGAQVLVGALGAAGEASKIFKVRR